jgi:hypothetical protein
LDDIHDGGLEDILIQKVLLTLSALVLKKKQFPAKGRKENFGMSINVCTV